MMMTYEWVDDGDDDDNYDDEDKCLIIQVLKKKWKWLFGIFIASLRLSYCTVYHLHCTTL